MTPGNSSHAHEILGELGLVSHTGSTHERRVQPMDFTNYLDAKAAQAPYTQERPMTRITINTPADLFNPAARDGALVWVALRLIPVALILAAVFTAVAT